PHRLLTRTLRLVASRLTYAPNQRRQGVNREVYQNTVTVNRTQGAVLGDVYQRVLTDIRPQLIEFKDSFRQPFQLDILRRTQVYLYRRSLLPALQHTQISPVVDLSG